MRAAPEISKWELVGSFAAACGRLACAESGVRALAFPDVIFAELFLVFLYLRFEFGEGHLGAATDIFAGAGGVKHAGWKREIHREIVFGLARRFFEGTVKDNEVRSVPFQQTIQFFNVVLRFFLDLLTESRFDMAVGDFHFGTLFRVGSPREGTLA
jgi:hypothetical protein